MEDSARGARSDAEERAAARARRDVVVFVVVVASVVAVLDGFLIFSVPRRPGWRSWCWR